MVYPDFVQTEVRERAIGPDGAGVGIAPPRDGAFMTAAECARVIVRAGARRRREVVVGMRGKVGLWLKMLAPRAVDGIARRAIEEVRFGPGGD